MNTTYHIRAKTYEEYQRKLNEMFDDEDPALTCANIEWEREENNNEEICKGNSQ